MGASNWSNNPSSGLAAKGYPPVFSWSLVLVRYRLGRPAAGSFLAGKYGGSITQSCSSSTGSESNNIICDEINTWYTVVLYRSLLAWLCRIDLNCHIQQKGIYSILAQLGPETEQFCFSCCPSMPALIPCSNIPERRYRYPLHLMIDTYLIVIYSVLFERMCFVQKMPLGFG